MIVIDCWTCSKTVQFTASREGRGHAAEPLSSQGERAAFVRRLRRSSTSLRRLRRDGVASTRQLLSMSLCCAKAATRPLSRSKETWWPKAIGARRRQVARSARVAVDLTPSTTMACAPISSGPDKTGDADNSASHGVDIVTARPQCAARRPGGPRLKPWRTSPSAWRRIWRGRRLARHGNWAGASCVFRDRPPSGRSCIRPASRSPRSGISCR